MENDRWLMARPVSARFSPFRRIALIYGTRRATNDVNFSRASELWRGQRIPRVRNLWNVTTYSGHFPNFIRLGYKQKFIFFLLVAYL